MIKKINDNQFLLEVNVALYEYNAILQTSYKFIDKCYIHIDPITENVIGIYFKRKNEVNSSLEEIIDSFCNELIDQQIRITTEKTFGSIRDEIVKKAFSPIN